MKQQGTHILCRALIDEGCEVIFGYPGGVIIPLYDIMPQHPIRHVLVRHEQCAAHMADGYARATGKAGVCLGTSGPGATNLVTGIANAMMDSVPMVAITGQVPTAMIGRDAFQETDIIGITIPIVKHSYAVQRTADIPRIVKEAFHIATTGRPGPVLIDIPKDVFLAEARYHMPDKVDLPGYRPTEQGNPRQIRAAAELINSARRPLIVAGHGVILARAWEELAEFSEKTNIPVITTYLGIGSMPASHPNYIGMPGMHGHYWNNKAIQECDLLIGIGMRFDDRVTGKLSTFAPHAKVIHVDIDPAEVGKNVKTAVPIVGDARRVLADLIPQVAPGHHPAWWAQIEAWKERHPSIDIPYSQELLPQTVIKAIYDADPHGMVVTDVGQHQMWAAQYFSYNHPNSHIGSGGLGTMGFALPAAMGVKVGCPERTVWAVAGDGGFQMTMQELATCVQERIDVKIAIVNNQYLGMVRQWQDLFHGKNYVGTKLFNPDYPTLAKAFGIPGYHVSAAGAIEATLRRVMAHDGPALVEFAVAPEENCYPMVAPGAGLSETMERPAEELLEMVVG